MKKKIAFHPFLFALHPVLSLFLHNWEKLPLREAIGTMAFVLFCTILLWLFVDLFVKDRNKSAIVVAVFVLLFFSYNHIFYAITLVLYYTGVGDVTSFLANARLGLLTWLCVWGILFGAVVYLIIKSSGDLSLATKVLNIVSLTLVVTTVASWYFNYNAEASVYADSWRDGVYSEDNTYYVGRRPDSLPDIYYIILDGYGRDDILQEIYEIDNSEFLSYLTQKGFYIADKSTSNYSRTALSLASSLNYMYLDELADQIGRDSRTELPLEVMVENSKVSQQLRSYGYAVYNFSSGYPVTEIESADVYMAPGWRLNSFQNELINITPLPVVLLRLQYDSHRERILYTLDHLADVTQDDSPTFVFAHIIAPHPPFVFEKSGDYIYPSRKFAFDDGSHFTAIAGRSEYVEGYRDQLAFITTRLQASIEQIVSQSLEPPIIIVQADHGPRSRLEAHDIQRSNLSEAMAILNAYYFPDQNYDALYRDITPVNSFRVVFNCYFGTDYEMLEDRSHFSTDFRPYEFVDVTSKIR
jgi:hypothetical protein